MKTSLNHDWVAILSVFVNWSRFFTLLFVGYRLKVNSIKYHFLPVLATYLSFVFRLCHENNAKKPDYRPIVVYSKEEPDLAGPFQLAKKLDKK